MRQCQLMRWTTTVSVNEVDYHCWNLLAEGREEGGEDVEWGWLCGGCVAPSIQEIRSAVVWAVLYSGLDECVCSTAMWMLCVDCGMGCGLPVEFRWAVGTWLRIGVPEA